MRITRRKKKNNYIFYKRRETYSSMQYTMNFMWVVEAPEFQNNFVEM